MKKLIPFLAGFLALTAHADAGIGLERLLLLSMDDLMSLKVKISTNTEQTLSKAPSVVSIITAEDIRATGTTNLMEILQSVPGVYIKTNLFGFKPLISFRGASGVNVLLMVNGTPAKDLVWSPSIFWKGMPANMVERIEIIRGPGSALFGSDASAGVINVITKTAGRIMQTEAGVRAGSFGTQAGWVQHGTTWNGFDVAFTADVSHTDGHHPFIAKDRINSPPGRANYGWDNQDIHFSLGKNYWRLLADFTRHDNVEIGLTGAAVLDPVTQANDSQTSLALLYNNEAIAKDWGFNAELRYRDIDYSSGNGFWELPPSVAPPVGPLTINLNDLSSAERRLSVEASALYGGIRSHAIRLGGGYVWQDLYFVQQLRDGVPGNFAPEKPRSNSYLFLQDVWNFKDDWELTAGARYDHYSDFGGTLNPRLALVWQTTERLTTKLMYGQAFRAPSYLELYSQTAANPPNPNLTPERSKTWDLSLSYRASKDLMLGANLYHFERSNVIAPETTAPYQFQNFDKYSTQGVELEAQWQATQKLMFSGNLTLRHDDDSIFRDVTLPTQTAYLRMDWAFLPRWNWNMQANWFDKRPLPAGDPRTPLAAYTLADTTLRYRHDKNREFAVSIRNLFDVDAREYSSKSLPNNLPLPERSLYAQIGYKF